MQVANRLEDSPQMIRYYPSYVSVSYGSMVREPYMHAYLNSKPSPHCVGIISVSSLASRHRLEPATSASNIPDLASYPH